MAKVADFGLSSRLFLNELKERMRDRAVELPTWLAPEVLSELPYTEKSDVYAFGVILWELYTGEHPFLEFRFKYQVKTNRTALERGGSSSFILITSDIMGVVHGRAPVPGTPFQVAGTKKNKTKKPPLFRSRCIFFPFCVFLILCLSFYVS